MKDRSIPSPPAVITRRTVALGALSTVAGSIVSSFASRASAAPARAPLSAHADALIVVWLNGGPSHIDTFDPKTTAAGGPFKSVATRAKGVLISEHLPLIADVADSYLLVRSLTSKEGNHQRAQYLVHTSYPPNPTIVHPSLGSWMSAKLSRKDAELPPFVSIGTPSFGGGFLGSEYGPFVLERAGASPPNIELAPGVDELRFRRRTALLDTLERRFAESTGEPSASSRKAVFERARRMMASPRVRAFDVSSETKATRESYGDTEFGRSCLVARRLVEEGVRCVEVLLDGWDNHQDNFTRVQKLSDVLDKGLSSLIRDLRERDLLRRTVVVCMGEFGRTPRINATSGRDHHPAAFSALLAGGRFKSGAAYGETDADGAKVVKDPIAIQDLVATLASELGLDPSHTVLAPNGRPIALTNEGKPVTGLIGA